MDHLLAGTDIRLTYLQDRRALARIDWPAIFDDLIDAGAPPNRCLWCDLDRLTHVVLATDRATGHYAGLLGLSGRTTGQDIWLLIDAAMTRPGDAGDSLALSMLAHALVRIVSLDGRPAALASARGETTMGSPLRALGDAIAAPSHPPAEGNVIFLPAAGLAQRIGSGGVVLDLRPLSEKPLLKDLRALHRSRVEKVSPKGRANRGGAMPRPRKATRTGRTG